MLWGFVVAAGGGWVFACVLVWKPEVSGVSPLWLSVLFPETP